jgi:hypothetical protein
MRSIRLNLSALRPIRLLVAVCICAFLVFSDAYPAFSAPVNPSSSKSAPEQGEAQLRSIEKEAQEAATEDPYSRKETQTKANEGLNEIQGAADIDKMKRPENAQADSVEEKLKKVLDKATGKG